MIIPIITDKKLLAIPSSEATKEDLYIIKNLRNSFNAASFGNLKCVGMAANIIGCYKQICIIDDNKDGIILINPTIIKRVGSFNTEERCICFSLTQPPISCTRHHSIKVQYYDEHFKPKIKTFTGLQAQSVQHQMDHFKGIVI